MPDFAPGFWPTYLPPGGEDEIDKLTSKKSKSAKKISSPNTWKMMILERGPGSGSMKLF